LWLPRRIRRVEVWKGSDDRIDAISYGGDAGKRNSNSHRNPGDENKIYAFGSNDSRAREIVREVWKRAAAITEGAQPEGCALESFRNL